MARSSTTRVKGQGPLPGAGRKPEVAHVRKLAQQYTEDAIKTLVEIMHDVGEKGPARVAAAQALLDRGHGKPSQPMEHSGADGEALGLVVQFVKPEGER